MTDRGGHLLTHGQHAEAAWLVAALRAYHERFSRWTFSARRSAALDSLLALEELLDKAERVDAEQPKLPDEHGELVAAIRDGLADVAHAIEARG